MKKHLFLTTILFFICLTIHAQTTVMIQADKDNTLYDHPMGLLSNGFGQHMFTGQNNNGLRNRAVLRFDLSAIPNGVTITGVNLRLNMSRTRPGNQSVDLHRLTSDWGEGTSNAPGQEGGGAASTTNDATWIHNFFSSSSWTTPGGDFNLTSSASIMVGAPGIYTWVSANMVTDVQNWLNTPANNFGWIIIGNETTSGTAKRFDTKEHPTVLNRPVLEVTYVTTIPIELSYFKAEKNNKGTLLKWETKTEINNDFFEIQRSQDNINFETIGKINGAGNSSEAIKYTFLDENPLSGTNCYRLKQVDFDGNFTFSEFDCIKIQKPLEIYPNPVQNEINFEDYFEVVTQVSIYNNIGQKVKQEQILPNQTQLNINDLKPGLYFLEIENSGKRIQFIKL